MVTDISLRGRCKQQQTGYSGLAHAFSMEREKVGLYTTIGITNKCTPGRGSDIEVSLSVLIQDLCATLGVDAASVVRAYKPLIGAALIHLASRPEHWHFVGDADGDLLFNSLFNQEIGKGLWRRRLQELFDMQDRVTSRYLIRRPREGWVASDNVDHLNGSCGEPALVVLDAVAIAELFKRSVQGPYFIWQN